MVNAKQPQSETEGRKLVQGYVERPLVAGLLSVIKPRKIKIRQVIDWGFRSYLLSYYPDVARRLGIEAPEEPRGEG